MRSDDLAGVRSVYDARARVSVGLMWRPREYWRRLRRQKHLRGIWFVAEHEGRIVGYAIGGRRGTYGMVKEVLWRPAVDDTDVPDRLFSAVRRRVRGRRAPVMFVAEMGGSPTIPTIRRAGIPPFDSDGVFMAAPMDRSALLRDAKRVLDARADFSVRLRVGKSTVIAGPSGRPVVTVTMDPEVLLGLLFGLRRLRVDIRQRKLRYTPRTERARTALRSAFPDDPFWIEDGW